MSVVKSGLVFLTILGLSFGGNPTDILKDAFSITRPKVVTDPDSSLAFNCKLAVGSFFDTCKIITDQGELLLVNMTTGSVSNNDTQALVIEGLTGIITDEDDVCGLNFTKFSDYGFGSWSCLMESGNEAFHQGTFYLLESGTWPKDIRLPEHLMVSHYDLKLQPDLDPDSSTNFTTDGTVIIDLLSANEFPNGWEKKIALNLNQIIIDEDSIEVKEKVTPANKILVSGHEYDVDRERYVIHLSSSMKINTDYVVTINFTSILNDDLNGFYRSSYIDKDTNETMYLGVTQFETTGARKSFPCFDEPDRKATYDVSLTHSNTTIARSNMEIIETTSSPMTGTITDKFETSVTMSTYLVAFLVADFGSTPNVNDSDYKIWHQHSKAEQAQYAASIGPSILEFYEEYFNLSYPLNKMDMAAIPDFSAGAMENWGLITYRETLLLLDKNVSAATDKESVTLVMAHELAHQWFGNIVTMKWWTDLWLNEGFATYVEYLGTEHAFPESHLRDRVVVTDLQDVFGLDALQSSKAITVEVTNPDYDAYFGRIAYAKGGCLLRMIEHYMTEAKFKLGVQKYLKKYKFSNAETKDLWDSLTEVSKDDLPLPINEIMKSWTTQPGYPVVTLDGKQISQTRFFLNATASDDESLWTIPISIAFPTEPNPGWEDTTAQVWLTKKVQNFTPDHTPYILNVQEAGYYRVNYAQDNWNSLSKLLNSDDFTKIHQLNRAQLIDDSLNLARSDKIDYKTALGLTRYLNKEDDYIPWQAASKGLSYLFTRFECQNCANAEDQERLNTFIIDILDHHYKDLGFNPPSDNDDHIRILSRSSASSWMCRMNYPDCIDKAKSQFKSWKESKTEIKADLKDNVYRTAIRMGGQAEWDFMYEQFKIVEIDSERQKYIYALGASEDPIILEKYLNMTLDRETSGIRLQDVIYIYRTISSSKIGRDVAMNWIENYYDFIDMAYGSATGVIGGGSFSKYVATIIAGYAGTANVQADIHRINAFIEEHTADLQGVSSSLTDSIKQALINVAWIENHYAQVVDWLKGTYPDDPPSAASMLNSNFMSVSSIIVILYSIFGQ